MGRDRRENSLPVALLAEGLIALPGLVMVALMFWQRGPWLWLVELELRLFEAYYPGYTLGFCLLVGAAGMWLVHIGLEALGWRRRVVGPRVMCLLQTWVDLPRWAGFVVMMAMLMGGFGLSVGLYNQVQIWTAGPRTQIDAASLEAGQSPGSNWLVVRGRPLLEQRVSWMRKSVVTGYTIPVVSEKWRPGDPVAVLVFVRGSENPRLPHSGDPAFFEGLMAPGPLPGLTRSSVEQNGVRLATNAILLQEGDTPESLRRQTDIFLMGGGIALPVGIVLWVILAWTTRSRS
jgi:hypothetical protein